MRRSTRRLIRKNTEFAALMLLGPLGGHITPSAGREKRRSPTASRGPPGDLDRSLSRRGIESDRRGGADG
jgi:hypothetical protein